MERKENSTHWYILGGLLLAVGFGFLLRNISSDTFPGSWTDQFIEKFLGICSYIGQLFIRALKMIIVPLIVSAIVSGIAGLSGFTGLARLGTKTIFLYLFSSFLAVLTGLFLVNTIQPGYESKQYQQLTIKAPDGSTIIKEVPINETSPQFKGELITTKLITKKQPSEVIQSVFRDADLQATPDEKERFSESRQEKATNYTELFKRMIPINIISAATDNGQVLGLIVFSILFGAAMVKVGGPEIRSVQGVMQGIHDVMIQVTFWIMKIAPIGVFGLIVPVVYRTGGELFIRLGKYFFTVLSALGIHFLIVMPLLLLLLGRINPLKHLVAMRSALLMAFSTASSAATLPVTMRSVEKKGISKKTASFTLPLGATVNMDGTALYECVAVLFVAQVMGIDLNLAAQFGIAIAALLTSIGVAGVPSASLVAILLILKNSGISGAETAVVSLLAVDRLLDMSRTAVNVYGDSCVAAIIDKSES